MDHSMRNVGNDGISDNITMKVKVADEEYHDLVLDWSDRSGQFKGKQVFDQVSSITGFPCESIDYVDIHFTPYNFITLGNVEKDEFWRKYDDFTHANYSEMFNDGDCFAISTRLRFSRGNFHLHINLNSRVMYTDNDCSRYYCPYVNTRAFLNRQIAIVTNAEFRMKLKSELKDAAPNGAENVPPHMQDFWIKNRVERELGIRQFMCIQRCRSNPDTIYTDDYRFTYPYYIRTRG